MESESSTDACSLGGNGEPPEDSSPFRKTYIALDGVKPEEIPDADMESLEQKVLQVALQELEIPVEDVRVVSSENTVIEMNTNVNPN